MGAAVGDEARILYYREGEHGGLCRWAPMAEPERDPRLEGQKKDLAKIHIWVVKWHLLYKGDAW